MEAIDYSEIDEEMIPLIKLLNEKHMVTTNCCIGHDYVGRNGTTKIEPAYIEFSEVVTEETMKELFTLIHSQDNDVIINDFSIEKYFRERGHGSGNITSRWIIRFPAINTRNMHEDKEQLKEKCYNALLCALTDMKKN